MEHNNSIVLKKEDFIENNGNLFMPLRKLAVMLGYKHLRKLHSLYSQHKDELQMFSSVTKMVTVDNKERNVLCLNELGCYTIAMLANTEKAKQFRKALGNFLIELRKGNVGVISKKEANRLLAERNFYKYLFFDFKKDEFIRKAKSLNQTNVQIVERLYARGMNYGEIADICEIDELDVVSLLEWTKIVELTESDYLDAKAESYIIGWAYDKYQLLSRGV